MLHGLTDSQITLLKQKGVPKNSLEVWGGVTLILCGYIRKRRIFGGYCLTKKAKKLLKKLKTQE